LKPTQEMFVVNDPEIDLVSKAKKKKKFISRYWSIQFTALYLCISSKRTILLN
jgi:hypothetical protein